jgi:transposase
MLKYFGGVTKTILCDNLRTVVTKSDRYEPVLTDLCFQLSEHSGTTFSAARPGKPTIRYECNGDLETCVLDHQQIQPFH